MSKTFFVPDARELSDFMQLEAAVNRYVTGYLNLDDRYR